MSDADTGAFRADGFGRKVGPFPIWGWALLLVAGVYIFHRFYSGASSSTASSSTNPYGAGAGTSGADVSAAPYQGDSSQNGTGQPQFYSNDAYNQAAIGEAGQFGSTALAVQDALTKYESGANLTSDQGSLVNRIIAALGGLPNTPASTSQIVNPAPPSSTPPPAQTPPPASKPAPAQAPAPAPQHTYYTVVRGDNLSSIARRFGTTWQTIYANNRGVIGNNPNLIYAGQTYVIR